MYMMTERWCSDKYQKDNRYIEFVLSRSDIDQSCKKDKRIDLIGMNMYQSHKEYMTIDPMWVDTFQEDKNSRRKIQ